MPSSQLLKTYSYLISMSVMGIVNTHCHRSEMARFRMSRFLNRFRINWFLNRFRISRFLNRFRINRFLNTIF